MICQFCELTLIYRMKRSLTENCCCIHGFTHRCRLWCASPQTEAMRLPTLGFVTQAFRLFLEYTI
jgi:hypothetical protein